MVAIHVRHAAVCVMVAAMVAIDTEELGTSSYLHTHLAANKRASNRSKRRHEYDRAYEPQGPQQVNVLGPVYVDRYEPDSPYISYDDWPPVDVYKRRWGGLLADRRLPWLTEDTFVDGNDIMRIPRWRSRRFGPYSVY